MAWRARCAMRNVKYKIVILDNYVQLTIKKINMEYGANIIFKAKRQGLLLHQDEDNFLTSVTDHLMSKKRKLVEAKLPEIKRNEVTEELSLESSTLFDDTEVLSDDSILSPTKPDLQNSSSLSPLNYVRFPSFPDSLFRVKTESMSRGSLVIWIENKGNKKQWKNTLKESDNLGPLGIPFEIMTNFLSVSTSYISADQGIICRVRLH